MAVLSTLLSDGSFGAATMLTGWAVWRCMKPPQVLVQTPGERQVRDTVASKPFLKLSAIFRAVFLSQILWQGLVCMDRRFALQSSPAFPLNNKFLTWNRSSAACFAMIWIGAYVRLRAMRELGKDFTFELHEPDELKTDGLYRYVQHPSYAGGVPAVTAAAFWFLRCDGVLTFVLPDQILRTQSLWNWLTPSVILLTAIVAIPLRIKEEESMLKHKFGKEWEAWHRRTARLIPFLI